MGGRNLEGRPPPPLPLPHTPLAPHPNLHCKNSNSKGHSLALASLQLQVENCQAGTVNTTTVSTPPPRPTVTGAHALPLALAQTSGSRKPSGLSRGTQCSVKYKSHGHRDAQRSGAPAASGRRRCSRVSTPCQASRLGLKIRSVCM
jgi:hypothetical protein